jgi:myosin-5
LGLGDLNHRPNPTLIESLKFSGEKISQVQSGLKHVIAKSTLGKIFTWGWGSKG